MHPKTVSRALKRGGAPSRKRPRARKSILDPYKPVIDRLLQAGVWNALVILRELQVFSAIVSLTSYYDFQ